MEITREFAMPNSITFSIPPIKRLLEREMTKGLWIDPFANNSKLATITNDLNEKFDTDYHLKAIDFLRLFDDNSVDGVLFDPPYSPRQIKECYNGVGLKCSQQDTSALFYKEPSDEIARIVKPGGKVISFGWNSIGMGKKRGFTISKILLVTHGGHHNDTIVTVDIKNI